MHESMQHIIVKEVISPELRTILAEYITMKARIKPIRRNDLLKNVHREYGDPLLELLLQRLTPLVEEATGLALWPTLSFYYYYKTGTCLPRHKDRSSCEIVAGLAIDADIDYKESHGSWPLVLNEEGKEVPVALPYGDLMIFRGHETEHWRENFVGKWFISAIFAFVDRNGPFGFQKFDQRKALGMPHVGMFNWTCGVLKNRVSTLLKR